MIHQAIVSVWGNGRRRGLKRTSFSLSLCLNNRRRSVLGECRADDGRLLGRDSFHGVGDLLRGAGLSVLPREKEWDGGGVPWRHLQSLGRGPSGSGPSRELLLSPILLEKL